MSALVDKFMKRIEDRYNEDMYFIESCFASDSKLSKRIKLMDLQLAILHEKNKDIVKKCTVSKIEKLST